MNALKKSYFKVRICGTLHQTRLYVLPLKLDAKDQWITFAENKSEYWSPSKTKTHNQQQQQQQQQYKTKPIDNALKQIIPEHKLLFSYSYDISFVFLNCEFAQEFSSLVRMASKKYHLKIMFCIV